MKNEKAKNGELSAGINKRNADSWDESWGVAEEEAPPRDGKKLPYPKAVAFIIGNEFCERFSYYGMKGILSIYLSKKLKFDEGTATVIYHTFSLFCYFTPVFGALLADQLLGKFRTIIYISLIYILGHLFKTIAAIPHLGIDPVAFSMVGLAFIALGTGGIKPCVSAFGGDQFKLPEQERQLQTFFSVFYFAINAGALISTFVTPILRQDVHCFGEETCYSLAFGVPALLMLIATVILFVGQRLYVMKPPQGNILTRVAGSIFYAMAKSLRKCCSRPKKAHWMDHALDKYPKGLVDDVKLLLKVLFIYLPLPVFWALFDQQGSTWTFQATRMDGALGSSYIIKPDQMQVINPILILVLIPVFDVLIYPLCARCNFLVKPLQRMTVGGLLAASSFVISAFLELALMKTYDHVPKANESHLHLMNTLPCPLIVNVNPGSQEFRDVDPYSNTIFFDLRPGVYDLEVRVKEGCDAVTNLTGSFSFEANDKAVTGLALRADSARMLAAFELEGAEEPLKSDDGHSSVRAVLDVAEDSGNHSLSFRPYGMDEGAIVVHSFDVDEGLEQTNYTKLQPSKYEVQLAGRRVGEVTIGQGGVRTLYITNKAANNKSSELEDDEMRLVDFMLTTENSVHMLWLVPQYVVITMGEVMFSVTGLEFSYSQAPKSMKSVVQAAWLWTVAFGNLIVVIVAEVKAFDNQASEFFMFAGLMALDMIIFAIMAYFFKYVDVGQLERERDAQQELREREEKRGQKNGFKSSDNDAYSASTDF